jgi:tripartite-type tricarboxylate transporter receptor subunit TctC
MEHTIDIPYEEALTITKEDVIVRYECTKEEAEEAMKYVGYFLEDYDPKDVEKYIKEDMETLDKLMKEKNDPS